MARKQSRPLIRGEYSVCLVDEATGLWTPPLFTKQNLLLYSWGYLACQSLGLGNPAFKVNAAYLEFKNVVNPGDVVPTPTYDRTANLSYYNSLPVNQDYLRVPLVGVPTIDIAPGYEPYFISGFNGNRVTFNVQSTGTVGQRGLTFGYQVNSKIFGIALVATPVFADPTQDVILARGYFRTTDQQLKQQGSQTGVKWRVAFE
jgi:hypothetical protein